MRFVCPRTKRIPRAGRSQTALKTKHGSYTLAMISVCIAYFYAIYVYELLELYHGVTSCFFGIGILLVSDLLDFPYFGRYRSPLFRILPPSPPPFFPKGGELLKRGPLPPF